MAFMECHFHSDVLGMASTMNIIMPQAAKTQIGMEGKSAAGDGAPVLYLLHGLSDDHSIWARRTSIERYAAPLGLAVVMPCAHCSFYANMVSGYRYWDFVSEELPQVVQSMFKVSSRREQTFVAGLSMGGYGAFKLGLRCPDKFAAACSLSGCVDMAGRAKRLEEEEFAGDMRLIYGTPQSLAQPDNDLLACASALAKSDSPRPLLYQWCGTEDFLYPGNVAFRKHAEAVGLELVYEESPGDHQWCHWDDKIQTFLALLVSRGLLS